MSNYKPVRPGPGAGVYSGIFLLCLSTLVYEIALTRLFSALMYYHFASMAIAIAFLGMGLGGMVVYLLPRRFGPEGSARAIPVICVLYGLSILLLFVAGVAVSRNPEAASGFLTRFHQPYFQPFRQGFTAGGLQDGGLPALMCLAGASMVPFFLAGLVVSAVLAAMPGKVNSLYLADMLGAGLGALSVIFVMGWLGGPGTLLFASVAGFAAAASFAKKEGTGHKPLRYAALGLLALTAILAVAEHSYGFVRFDFVGGRYEPDVLDTKWNSYSRVMVYRGKTSGMQERAWGVSRSFKGTRPEELNIVINDTGYTTMVKDGPASGLECLKYDVTNLPFMLKGGGKSLVIGPGGGRDVLSALLFGSKDVTAVEVNPLLKDIVDDSFGDFTGRLYSRPGVRLVIDDGRSFLMRDAAKYDVIESARVYEWMEATSGAFTLSENYLYTKEAFSDYLGHLADGGMLSITRFIYEKQAMRIISLAIAAYKDMGVDDPSGRIAILKERGLATFLFKKTPFTDEEITRLGGISSRLGFEPVYLPGRAPGNEFAKYITAADKDAFVEGYPLDISPSTDDNPFFNFMVKRADFWEGFGAAKPGGFHNAALMLIRDLFIVMAALSFLVFVLPLLFLKRKDAVRSPNGLWRLLVYFGVVGMAFMLVEITFLRKFILFLGHPIYSLSVVLFVLLVSTGAGSALSAGFKDKAMTRLMWLAPFAVLLYSFLPGMVFGLFMGGQAITRIAVSVVLLFPVGLLLGIMFPAGIRLAGKMGLNDYIPWLWAVNGIFSVFGTLFALVFAMSLGFSATVVAAAFMYAAASAVGGRAWAMAGREAGTP